MRQNKTAQEKPETEEDRKRREDYPEFYNYTSRYERAFEIARKLKKRGQIQKLERFCESMAKQAEALPSNSCHYLNVDYSTKFWFIAGKEREALRVFTSKFQEVLRSDFYHYGNIMILWARGAALKDLQSRGFPEYLERALVDEHRNYPQGEIK